MIVAPTATSCQNGWTFLITSPFVRTVGMNAPTADTLENLPLPENGVADKELIEEEVAATNEGMPAGELDEEPRKAESAAAGE